MDSLTSLVAHGGGIIMPFLKHPVAEIVGELMFFARVVLIACLLNCTGMELPIMKLAFSMPCNSILPDHHATANFKNMAIMILFNTKKANCCLH